MLSRFILITSKWSGLSTKHCVHKLFHWTYRQNWGNWGKGSIYLLKWRGHRKLGAGSRSHELHCQAPPPPLLCFCSSLSINRSRSPSAGCWQTLPTDSEWAGWPLLMGIICIFCPFSWNNTVTDFMLPTGRGLRMWFTGSRCKSVGAGFPVSRHCGSLSPRRLSQDISSFRSVLWPTFPSPPLFSCPVIHSDKKRWVLKLLPRTQIVPVFWI